MTDVERSAYLSRVGDWLSISGQCLVKKGEPFEARLQNVLQVSAAWNDLECAAFEEGAVLLSALAGTCDTWLPDMLYTKSAKRAIKQMFQLLWQIEASASMNADGMPKEERAEETSSVTHAVGDGSQTVKRRPGRPKRVTGAPSPLDGKGTDVTENTEKTAKGGRMQAGAAKEALLFADDAGTGVPVRPRHFDQYAHLLPQKTQEHIAQYGPLMRDLDVSREKLRLLMEDPTASARDREAWAKKVDKIDKQVGDIRKEADAEWEKVVQSGGVAVDDLGMARVLPSPESPTHESPIPESPTPDPSPEGAGSATAEDSPLGAGGLKARRRSLRKWLTDTRNGKGDQREKHQKKWRENFREYHALEGDAAFEDEKIIAAAQHYGIDLIRD